MGNFKKPNKPIVLIIAGHDPSGGAGIQADIESVTANHCHAATVITALTTQNTSIVRKVIPQQPDDLLQQLELVFSDMDIAACKLGLFANAELIDIAYAMLSDKNIPIVFDPVIAASSGKLFSDESICKKLISTLVPLATVVTPNADEARRLTESKSLEIAAEKLMQQGAQSVLITGTDEKTKNVINTFYYPQNPKIEYAWARLSGQFHGSGCTLSSSIAAQLAQGKALKEAIVFAQEYTWQSLQHGLDLGKGQQRPNRFYNHENI